MSLISLEPVAHLDENLDVSDETVVAHCHECFATAGPWLVSEMETAREAVRRHASVCPAL